MTIASFDDLLRSASQQTEPQRLLFVFTAAGLMIVAGILWAFAREHLPGHHEDPMPA